MNRQRTPWRLVALAAVLIAAIVVVLKHDYDRAGAAAGLHCPAPDHVVWGYVQGRGTVPMCGASIGVTVGSKP